MQKLNVVNIPINAMIKINKFNDINNSILYFDSYSFANNDKQSRSGAYEIRLKGELLNLNTIEDFNQFDFKKCSGTFYK